MADMKPRLLHHPHGITAVDTEYIHPGTAAAHIIKDAGHAAIVDVGTSYSVAYLLAALDVLGIPREAVDYVFLTHVHLDHAGGAGRLMRELPNALAVVHPRGAPHMIDPEKVIAGSKLVYGAEHFDRLYGEILPIAEERLRTVRDGERFTLGARTLELIHTPGHALHHYAIVDAGHASIFPGDTFGISYRELDTAQGAFIYPTTTPTQFDPDQLVASVDRLLGYQPESMYLMHYSRVTDVARLGELVKMQIGEIVRISHRHAGAPDRYTAIRSDMLALWIRLLRQHGSTLPHAELERLLQGDLDLNTQGLVVWLDRLRKD